jgi:hypothetical protein
MSFSLNDQLRPWLGLWLSFIGTWQRVWKWTKKQNLLVIWLIAAMLLPVAKLCFALLLLAIVLIGGHPVAACLVIALIHALMHSMEGAQRRNAARDDEAREKQLEEDEQTLHAAAAKAVGVEIHEPQRTLGEGDETMINIARSIDKDRKRRI